MRSNGSGRSASRCPALKRPIKYDGSPLLKAGGSFMAGLATDEFAEADTLVVRCEFDDRELLLEDAPDTYYVTDYHAKYPRRPRSVVRGDGRRAAGSAVGVAKDGARKEPPPARLILLTAHRQQAGRFIEIEIGDEQPGLAVRLIREHACRPA